MNFNIFNGTYIVDLIERFDRWAFLQTEKAFSLNGSLFDDFNCPQINSEKCITYSFWHS